MPSDVARLYSATWRTLRALRHDAGDALVGLADLSALARLTTEGPQRPGTLANSEGISAPAMARVLRSLEKNRYIVRTVDPADGRASFIAATPFGRDLVLKAQAQPLIALQARLDRLDSRERDLLSAALSPLERLADG